MHRNFAPAVEMTLLKRSFAVVRSAVGVYVLPKYVMRLPLMVNLILYGSSF